MCKTNNKVDKKIQIYKVFNEIDKYPFQAGEIVDIELNDNCSRVFIKGEEYNCVYLYEAEFIDVFEADSSELTSYIIDNAVEVLRYTDKDNYETIYSIYNEGVN